jgi:hypothetical protein
MYKLTNRSDQVMRIEDRAFIPLDPSNTDYQAYLKWLEEGNTPLAADAAIKPADEPTTNQGGL